MKSSITPPRLATRFFTWYCRNDLQDSILGDLHEQFEDHVAEKGKLRAQLHYWTSVIMFINRYTLKKRKSHHHQSTQIPMFRNYLLTSFRYLKKHKTYSFINISGLSIALASCILILLFIHHERSFDRFHSNSKNIYRISTIMHDASGNGTHLINTAPAVAPVIREAFPEVEKSTQLRYASRNLFQKDEQRFYEKYGFYADSLFLEIFNFKLKSGNASTALDEPNSIVITEHFAHKYFGNTDPMGQLLTFNSEHTLKVTGILEPVPTNSHIQFDYLISFTTYVVPEGVVSDLSSWRWLGFLTYVSLVDGASPEELKSKLDQLYKEKNPELLHPNIATVQPLTDLYHGSNSMIDDLSSNLKSGNESTIYVLAIIALLILVIASFNFMNLNVAISVNRGKEAGLRKVLGASKGTLTFQMLSEAVVVAMISLILALILCITTFPHLNEVFEWHMSVDMNIIIFYLPIMVLAVVLLGLVSGIYPALLLARAGNLSSLKGTLLFSGGNPKVKYPLIVFQFCISICLIAATIVITRQIDFMRRQSLGYDKENVMLIQLEPRSMRHHYNTFKNTLLQHSEIKSVTKSGRMMGGPWPINEIRVLGKDNLESQQVSGNWVDYDFLKTMGIVLKEGRDFSAEFSNDSLKSIIINEKAAEYLGLENPIGQEVDFFSFDGPRTIIGVVEDFNFSSFHHDITPTVMILPFLRVENMYIRVAPGNIHDQIALIQQSWKQIGGDIPLDIQFLGNHLNRLYGKEKKLSHLITAFSILAIFLACLGLYGLVGFEVKNALKEIGIRKILGASILSLMVLLSRKYIALIVISAVISIPAIHYTLGLWLDNFAYHTELPWWIYIVTTCIVIILALVTISRQTIAAALSNPVEVLKDE